MVHPLYTTRQATMVTTRQSEHDSDFRPLQRTSYIIHILSLAIARIFGGFPKSFFDTYHAHRPKSEPVEEHEERADLYQLFHYLNHTLLFGVSYTRSSNTGESDYYTDVRDILRSNTSLGTQDNQRRS